MRKHLNFIPPELRAKLEIPYGIFPVVCVLFLCLYAGGAGLRISIASYLDQRELARLEITQQELSEKLKVVTEQTRIVSQNTESFNSLQKVISRKNYWSEIFKEMSILIPEGVWLTQFTNRKADAKDFARIDTKAEAPLMLKPVARPGGKGNPKAGVGVAEVKTEAKMETADQLILRGESDSALSIAQFLMTLEQSHFFTGVRLIYSEKEISSRPTKFKFEFAVPIRPSTGGNG